MERTEKVFGLLKAVCFVCLCSPAQHLDYLKLISGSQYLFAEWLKEGMTAKCYSGSNSMLLPWPQMIYLIDFSNSTVAVILPQGKITRFLPLRPSNLYAEHVIIYYIKYPLLFFFSNSLLQSITALDTQNKYRWLMSLHKRAFCSGHSCFRKTQLRV